MGAPHRTIFSVLFSGKGSHYSRLLQGKSHYRHDLLPFLTQNRHELHLQFTQNRQFLPQNTDKGWCRPSASPLQASHNWHAAPLRSSI